MTSDRHSPDPILLAARTAILDIGVRRTTVAEIARRAQISRMTVYRQYADRDAIVSALLTDELVGLFAAARTEVTALPSARARLVAATGRLVATISTHPLYRRVLDLDPELLLPLVVDRLGSTQRAAIDQLTEELQAGRQDGSIRPLDEDLAAFVIQLVAQSFVFSARVVAARGHPDRVHAQLGELLDRYLAP